MYMWFLPSSAGTRKWRWYLTLIRNNRCINVKIYVQDPWSFLAVVEHQLAIASSLPNSLPLIMYLNYSLSCFLFFLDLCSPLYVVPFSVPVVACFLAEKKRKQSLAQESWVLSALFLYLSYTCLVNICSWFCLIEEGRWWKN